MGEEDFQKDQGEGIVKYLNDGLSQIELLLKVVTDVQKSYADISKAHRKLVQRHQPKDPKGKKETEDFTFTVGLQEVFTSINSLSSHHDSLAESLRKDVIGELKTLHDESRKRIDKVRVEFDKMRNQLNKQRNVLERVTSRYRSVHANMVKAQDTYERSEQDKTLSRLEVERTRQIWDSRKDDYNKAKGDYAKALQVFNSYQRTYYTKQIPEWSAECELIDRERVSKSRDVLIKFSTFERTCSTQVNETGQYLETSANKMNHAEDSRILITRIRLGHPHPGDLAFIDLENNSSPHGSTDSMPHTGGSGDLGSGGTVRQSKKGLFKTLFKQSNNKEQEADLSQEELVKRIGDMKLDLKKSNSELEALLKLKGTYEVNSNLGDPASVEPNIETCSRRIQSLTELLSTYEKQVLGTVSTPGNANKNDSRPESIDDEWNDDFDDPVEDNPGNPQSSALPSQTAAPVEVVAPDSTPAPTYLGSCTALFPFKTGGPGYLEMEADDQFYILEADNNGWTMVVSLPDMLRTGLIPTNYLEVRYF